MKLKDIEKNASQPYPIGKTAGFSRPGARPPVAQQSPATSHIMYGLHGSMLDGTGVHDLLSFQSFL